MKKAWIGAGSNLGDRMTHLRGAFEELAKQGIRLIRCSSVYETQPSGFESEDLFLNCVAEIGFECTPHELLALLLATEQALGRTRNTGLRYASRTIDLDILLIENEVINTAELQVPHPLMHQRAFVLVPLNELIPRAFHPVLNQAFNALENACIDKNTVFIHDKALFVNR